MALSNYLMGSASNVISLSPLLTRTRAKKKGLPEIELTAAKKRTYDRRVANPTQPSLPCNIVRAKSLLMEYFRRLDRRKSSWNCVTSLE